MEEKQLLEIWEIEDRDWLQTPMSVRRMVVGLGKEVEQLSPRDSGIKSSEGTARRESQPQL